jgi:hypothetical protein
MADHRRPKDMWRAGDGPSVSGGASSAQRKSSRGKRRFLNALLFAALVGVVVGFIAWIWPSKKAVFLSIPVTEYSDRNWPVNAWAQRDAEAIAKLIPEGKVAFQSQERHLILRELNQLADRSRDEDKGRPVIIHFSANGLVRDGVVYALPGDARSGEPGTWLRLEDLFEPIRRVEGKCLVILDLRPVVSARLCGLSNDLPETLRSNLERSNLPFTVVCPNAPSAFPYASRDLRRGFFGWFLDRGLGGTADGWNAERDLDKRVSAHEWLDFAGNHTERLTGRLGLPDQPPARFGAGADFEILPVPQKGPTPAPQIEMADEYPQWLLLGWQERDRWRADGSYLRLQRTYRHLEAALQRAESLWLGGFDAGKAQTELENERDELKAIKKKYPAPIPPTRSLAQSEKAGIKKEKETREILQKVLKIIKNSPEPKKEDQGELEKELAKFNEKPPDPDAAAAILFAAALDRPEPSIEQLRMLTRVLDAVPNAPKYAEWLMMRFVTELDARLLKLWEPATIPRVLRAAQAAERAAAVDGRCLPWLLKDLVEADKLRRLAMDKLARGLEETDRTQARAELDACTNRYGEIAAAGKALENALTLMDEMRLFLIVWVDFEAPDPRIEGELNKLWSVIVAETRQLQALLQPPATPALPAREVLSNRTNDLINARTQVIKLIDPPASASAFDLQRWLVWPLWTSERRSDLCERLRQVSFTTLEKALRSPPEKPSALAKTATSVSPIDPTVITRARRALDVLMLAGEPELDKLERQLSALRPPYDAGKVQELAQAIESRWRDKLAERYRQGNNLADQAHVGWAIHPFDLPAIPRSNETFKRDAAADFFQKAQKEFVDRLARERDQADANVYAKVESKAAKDLAIGLNQLASDQQRWVRD